MNIRKNGFVLLAVSLGFVFAVSELCTRYLEKSRSAVHEAQLAYVTALAQTRAQLASHLFDLVHDPVLISNLNAQLSYSISRSLEGEIHPGSLDFFVIFDADCKPIVKTMSTPVPAGLCQKNNKDQWLWTSVSDKPLLFLLKSRSDLEKPFYIGAGRFLNDTWGASFPMLLPKLEAADLIWGSGISKTLCKGLHLCSEFHRNAWVDGRDAEGTALASLISLNRLFPILRPWLISTKPLSNPFALPLIIFISLLCILEALQRRFSKTKTDEERIQFLRWCKQPLLGRVRTPEMKWLQTAQESLLTTLNQCANRCSELTKASEKYEQVLLGLKAELAECERKLSEHIPYQVLSMHIASSGSKVQQTLASFQEGTADLASMLDKGLLTQNRKMLELVKLWQNGIALRGERHFMRSLYEQEGKQEGESLLRAELNKLFSIAEHISSLSLHCLSLLREIQIKESSTASIVEHWSMLAGKVQDSHLKLSKIGEVAAALLQADSPQRVSFLSNLPHEFKLNLPVPTLLGTFLMLFTAMKEGTRDAKDETLVFQVHKRQKLDQFILALSLTNERGRALLCQPKEELLQRVVELLKPWGIQCQDIRRPEGGSYIIIRGSSSLFSESLARAKPVTPSVVEGPPA